MHVLPADSPPADIAAAMSAALAEQDAGADGSAAATAWSQPLEALPADDRPGRRRAGGRAGHRPAGRGLGADRRARAHHRRRRPSPPSSRPSGVPTLLADADVYGGVVAQVLGFLDEAPGLAAAARLANNGQLDVAALAAAAPQAAPNLRVLTGISRADRWPELRPSALEQVWELARSLAAVTVVDLGFCLEQDEELSFDTAAPRRNGATLATLGAADTVLAVGAADPVGMQRLVRGLTQLREAVPGALPRVVRQPGPARRGRRRPGGPARRGAGAVRRRARRRRSSPRTARRSTRPAAGARARRGQPRLACPARAGRRRRRAGRAARAQAPPRPAAPRRLIIRLG